jgi:PTH1 family peptidyl-tRNA hydrolase
VKLIVGLGNPGMFYRWSRHNIGFQVVKALGGARKAAFRKEKATSSLTAQIKIAGSAVILALPLSFMNRSGGAVQALLERYRLQLKDILVVCDDLDLPFGRLKIRPGGSSGGHRGLGDIVKQLQSEGFPRLRLGIGRPRREMDAASYVLGRFNAQEKRQLKGLVKKALDCCHCWVTDGISASMNLFNRKEQQYEEV